MVRPDQSALVFKLDWLRLFSKTKNTVDAISSAQCQSLDHERKAANTGCILSSLLIWIEPERFISFYHIYVCYPSKKENFARSNLISSIRYARNYLYFLFCSISDTSIMHIPTYLRIFKWLAFIIIWFSSHYVYARNKTAYKWKLYRLINTGYWIVLILGVCDRKTWTILVHGHPAQVHCDKTKTSNHANYSNYSRFQLHAIGPNKISIVPKNGKG